MLQVTPKNIFCNITIDVFCQDILYYMPLNFLKTDCSLQNNKFLLKFLYNIQVYVHYKKYVAMEKA